MKLWVDIAQAITRNTAVMIIVSPNLDKDSPNVTQNKVAREALRFCVFFITLIYSSHGSNTGNVKSGPQVPIKFKMR